MSGEVSWTRAEAREFDRRAIEELGIPSPVLMENAGRGAADWILARRERFGLAEGARVGVLCGKGNNGGDGYVLARHLSLAGLEVVVGESAPCAELSRDARVFRDVCAKMGVELVSLAEVETGAGVAELMGPVALWVDSVLGTGFLPPLREPLRTLLGAIGEAVGGESAPLIALDAPSGLDVDTGEAAESCLRATATLTFGAMKVGFGRPEAASALGEAVCLPLGAP